MAGLNHVDKARLARVDVVSNLKAVQEGPWARSLRFRRRGAC